LILSFNIVLFIKVFIKIVAPDGFKPPFSESKSDILSLDEGAIWSVVGLQSPEAPTQVTPL
jgi:hypothetical protein